VNCSSSVCRRALDVAGISEQHSTLRLILKKISIPSYWIVVFCEARFRIKTGQLSFSNLKKNVTISVAAGLDKYKYKISKLYLVSSLG
jgi:hypothetical protein